VQIARLREVTRTPDATGFGNAAGLGTPGTVASTFATDGAGAGSAGPAVVLCPLYHPHGMSEHPAHPHRADQFLLHGNRVYLHGTDHVLAEFTPIPTGYAHARRITLGILACAFAFAGVVWLATSGLPVPHSIIITAMIASLLGPLFVLYFNPPRASFAMVGSMTASGAPPDVIAEIDDTIKPARSIRSLDVHARGSLLGIIELAGVSQGTPARARILESSGSLRIEGRATGTALHVGAAALLSGTQNVLGVLGSSREHIERAVAKQTLQTWTFQSAGERSDLARLIIPPAESFASQLDAARDLREEDRTLLIVCAWALSRR
jgi:hypothetical protein